MSNMRMPEQANRIESVILHELGRIGPCTYIELLAALPEYTWNQMFLAVDRLSRAGLIVLKKEGPFDYRLSARSNNLPACNISLTPVSND